MKEAILKFNLPEEQDELTDAINGTQFKMAVWNYSQWLRSELKHNDELTQVEYDVLEIAQAKLFESLEEQSLSLD